MKTTISILIIFVFIGTNFSFSQTTNNNIAVLDFDGKNISAVDASVATDFLRTAIVNMRGFKVVDRKNMEILLKEQGFQASGCTTEDCAVKIGKILNVQRIIIGSISKLSDCYYITGNIVAVESGEIISSRRTECSAQEKLVDKMESLAEKLMDKNIIDGVEANKYIFMALNAIKTQSYELATHNLKMALLEGDEDFKAASLLLYVYTLNNKIQERHVNKVLPIMLYTYWGEALDSKKTKKQLKQFSKHADITINTNIELCHLFKDIALHWFKNSGGTEHEAADKIIGARILITLKEQEAADWMIKEIDSTIFKQQESEFKINMSEIITIGDHMGMAYLKNFANNNKTSSTLAIYLKEIVKIYSTAK